MEQHLSGVVKKTFFSGIFLFILILPVTKHLLGSGKSIKVFPYFYLQSSQLPRHSLSLSAVCPGNLSWDLVLVSSDRLEKPGIEPTTPGLEGNQLNHYAMEASALISCSVTGQLICAK